MVYLIGAGAGDPELITLKAVRILKQVDVVLYDYLVHPNIVLIASQAEKICVGKKKGAHSTLQVDINDQMVKYAEKGLTVARLKGGDPMVFGRCGEEMMALNRRNILYEVIPGISSAIAVPTYAGIPITHRDFSHSVAFVTATRANDVQAMEFPNADTLVIMMSLLRLSPLIKRLVELRSPDTPIAIIESGTYASEKKLIGTLSTIENMQDEFALKPPALLVVGDVVKHHNQFDWRAHLPLINHRFVIFRSEHQQSSLRDALSILGAEVLTLSLNKITFIKDCLNNIKFKSVTHLVFTSENGVRSFFNAYKQMGDIRSLSSKIICSIGPHTTNTLAEFGIKPEIISELNTSEALFSKLKRQINSAHHVLIPTSSEAGNEWEILSSTKAKVEQIISYNNDEPNDILQKLEWVSETDKLVFMNSAAVNRFAKHYVRLNEHTIFSIGPKTSAALKANKVIQIFESKVPSIEDMISTITKKLIKK